MPEATRSKARRLAFLIAYAMEYTGYGLADTLVLIGGFKEEFAVPPPFAYELCAMVEQNKTELESEITAALENWKLPRVGTVERALLKLAAAEICYCADIPPRVTINEYLELSKKYANENSPAFVNGVLDRIVRSRKKPDFQINKRG